MHRAERWYGRNDARYGYTVRCDRLEALRTSLRLPKSCAASALYQPRRMALTSGVWMVFTVDAYERFHLQHMDDGSLNDIENEGL